MRSVQVVQGRGEEDANRTQPTIYTGGQKESGNQKRGRQANRAEIKRKSKPPHGESERRGDKQPGEKGRTCSGTVHSI